MRSNGVWMVVSLVAGALLLAYLGHRYRLPRPAELPIHGGPILLVSIDNLRADRLGCYGYGRPTSPHLDALAGRGLVFEDVTSTSNWTLPSHASMFTSLRPRNHGVVHHGYRLDEKVPTLAEHLASTGYHTAAFVAHANVSSALGLAQGFDEWTDAWRGHVGPPADPPAAGLCRDVLDHLTDRLSADPRAKEFVLLHLFTVHWPFEPEEPYRSLLAGGYDGPVDGSGAWVTRYLAEIHSPDEQPGFDHLSDLYDAEIATVDAALGALFDGLEARGLLEPLTVMVTADHGEAFKEHGVFTHGFSMFQEEIRVPLLLKLPETGVEPPPRGRIVRPASLLDVAPTLLDLARAEPLADAEGDNLLNPALPDTRFLISESSLDHLFMDFERVALRAGPIKYIFAPAVDWYGARYGEAAFHLLEDPGERSDLLPGKPGLDVEFRHQLERYGYRIDTGIGIAIGAELPAGVAITLRAKEPLVHCFRARTASRPTPAGVPEQSDLGELTFDLEGDATRVDVGGITTHDPSGVFVSSGSQPTDLTIELTTPGDLELPVQTADGALLGTLSAAAPLQVSGADLPPFPPHHRAPPGTIQLGGVEILRYAGPIRGVEADELSAETLQALRAAGYLGDE